METKDEEIFRFLGAPGSRMPGPDCCVAEVEGVVERLVRAFQRYERDQIREHGVTSSQAFALLEIRRAGEPSMNELSARLNLDGSTVTRVVDILVREGWVRRERCPQDRRMVRVELTPEGQARAERLWADLMSFYRRIVAGIPKGRVEEVLRSTQLLLDAFERAHPGCC